MDTNKTVEASEVDQIIEIIRLALAVRSHGRSNILWTDLPSRGHLDQATLHQVEEKLPLRGVFLMYGQRSHLLRPFASIAQVPMLWQGPSLTWSWCH